MDDFNSNYILEANHIDCNSSTQFFQDTIVNYFNECFPLKAVELLRKDNKNNFDPVQNTEVKKLVDEKHEFWAFFKCTRDRAFKKKSKQTE